MTDIDEGTHVGTLLDIGERLARINRLSNEHDTPRLGIGYKDMPYQKQENASAVAVAILKAQPATWYTLLQANLLLTQTAESHEILRSGVMQVAALAAAWLVDLDERATANK